MRMSKFIYLISALFLTASLVFAQSGRIQGYVTDETTGDVLVGANVMLEGTSMGASTDLEGKYAIEKVSAGSYTLVVRYIGYQDKTTTVEVVAGETTNLTISLLFQALEGEVIVVQAQAEGQLRAINEQLSSQTIKNVVSAERIRELPDDNAATALSRLPGVSLMNGDQIVIRGVQAKLNQVLVNGIQLPSTNMGDRATGLGFVSSNMLSGIEVIKAITPDMDANTIGGVVNLKIREAQPGFHFDVLTQGNYNQSDGTTNNFKFWASLSNRFFNDKFGVFIQGNADRSDGGNQSASITPGYVGGEPGNQNYKTNSARMSYDWDIVNTNGGSIILDYKLPQGKIVLQNTYAATFTDQRNNTIGMNFDNDDVEVGVNRNKFNKNLWINALQAENNFGLLKVEASLSHSYTDQQPRRAYFQYSNQTNFINIEENRNPFGGYYVYQSPALQEKIDLNKAYEIFDNIDPDYYLGVTLEGWPGSVTDKFNQHLYNASLDFTMPFNFTKNITSTFKLGGKLVRTVRENDHDLTFSGASDDDTYNTVETYFGPEPENFRDGSHRLRFTDVQGDFDRGENFLSDEYDFKNGYQYIIDTEIYDDWLYKAQKGWTPSIKMDDSWRDDFNGAETYTAAYLMGTFNIYRNLTLLGGLRFENYNMKYRSNFTVTIHNVYGNAISTHPDAKNIEGIPYDYYHVDRDDANFFPNFQLKYKPNDWMDFRAAYTTGVSRPDYGAIAPKIWIFPSADQWELGNPKLRPTTVQNIDLIASFYSDKVGLFTIDGFYKELEDVQFGTTVYYKFRDQYSENDLFIPDSAFLYDHIDGYRPRPNATIGVNYNNPNPGYIRGIEVDWQTNFWYLPKPLNSIVFNINYTKSWSDMDYRQIRLITTTVFDSTDWVWKNEYSMIDTIYSGRLVQQAEDVINAALGIDYKGFSGRISFNMRGNVLNNASSTPENISYTGNIYRWDLTLKQRLPIKGLSLALNGVNIFHNPIKSYRKYKLNADAPTTENLVSIVYPSTIYQLNLRYEF